MEWHWNEKQVEKEEQRQWSNSVLTVTMEAHCKFLFSTGVNLSPRFRCDKTSLLQATWVFLLLLMQHGGIDEHRLQQNTDPTCSSAQVHLPLCPFAAVGTRQVSLRHGHKHCHRIMQPLPRLCRCSKYFLFQGWHSQHSLPGLAPPHP